MGKSTVKPKAKASPKKAQKPVASKAAKPASKKPAKASKPLVKTLMKSVTKAAGKLLSGKTEKPTPSTAKVDKAEKSLSLKKESPTKTTVPAASKAPKKAKKTKAKEKADEFDMGDDLVGDEDLGAEEIPDLAEFEESELKVDEVEESDELEVKASDVPGVSDHEVILTDAEGRRYCRVKDCDQIGVVEGYCRFHYMQLWKKIQVRRKILGDGKLDRYVDELTARYPDKFLEMIRKDLRSEKDFMAAIAELEIDESAQDNEFEDESASFIEEVRGMTEASSSMSDDEEF